MSMTKAENFYEKQEFVRTIKYNLRRITKEKKIILTENKNKGDNEKAPDFIIESYIPILNSVVPGLRLGLSNIIIAYHDAYVYKMMFCWRQRAQGSL